MDSYLFLQQYWWFIICLLFGIVVSSLFVQGGQSLLYTIGKTREEQDLIAHATGNKWKFTFTLLVTFGGTFFAAFPLFYAVSFGGASYLWTVMLISFVLQGVSFEFRRKQNNLLGRRGFNLFLIINGLVGPFFLGVIFGTFVTGGNFVVDRMGLANIGGRVAVTYWTNSWHGLDALADYRNLCLGIAILAFSRVIGAQFLLDAIDDKVIGRRAHRQIFINALIFYFFYLIFATSMMFSDGWATDPESGKIWLEETRYFNNLIEMPWAMITLVTGMVLVLAGITVSLIRNSRRGLLLTALGGVISTMAFVFVVGFNNSSYYPSLVDPQSSLTIYNSSASKFTLQAMTVVSFVIPVVVWYIWYAWRAMDRTRMTREMLKNTEEEPY